jgi:phosphatidylinositol glycan class A protein
MGYTTVYTDHSLFSLNDLASINLNKLLKFTLTTVDGAICVSHTCRENLVIRASVRPDDVAVIPNAVDTVRFTPDLRVRNSLDPNVFHVIVISRLVYRKGVDLLVDIIPQVCARVDNVNFIIGGDGPKRLVLEEMVEKYELDSRVKMLGQLTNRQVKETLVRGHIFLNCSLTESFCIAILEAASCGLYVVSTSVGGIPEVLPDDMVTFAEKISAQSLTNALLSALPLIKKVDPMEFHNRVKSMYHWRTVAERTSQVYDNLTKKEKKFLYEKLLIALKVGPVLGIIAMVLLAIDMVLVNLVEYFHPEGSMERAKNFPIKLYAKSLKSIHMDEKSRKEIRVKKTAALQRRL